jgi:hypothetical protein
MVLVQSSFGEPLSSSQAHDPAWHAGNRDHNFGGLGVVPRYGPCPELFRRTAFVLERDLEDRPSCRGTGGGVEFGPEAQLRSVGQTQGIRDEARAQLPERHGGGPRLKR